MGRRVDSSCSEGDTDREKTGDNKLHPPDSQV